MSMSVCLSVCHYASISQEPNMQSSCSLCTLSVMSCFLIMANTVECKLKLTHHITAPDHGQSMISMIDFLVGNE